jgi:hypothetical protein
LQAMPSVEDPSVENLLPSCIVVAGMVAG